MPSPNLPHEGLTSRDSSVENEAAPSPTFQTILADPPWDVLQDSGRGARRHYPLMTVEQIAALPVEGLATTDAQLWLWVTNATLFVGQAVMTAWGFTYRSCLTWVKPGFGLGSYLRIEVYLMEAQTERLEPRNRDLEIALVKIARVLLTIPSLKKITRS